MREIRCPRCHRLVCKAVLNGTSAVEIRCRCKTLMAVYAHETLIVSVAASPTISVGDPCDVRCAFGG
jgi:phage FluMu protein Com